MEQAAASANFIRTIVNEYLREQEPNGEIVTRFPPEPNGHLHIGHAKSICLNFGIAAENRGLCNLRFDDTNPTKEKSDYVNSIKNDVRWLGFEWNGPERYASDYFDQLYSFALELIRTNRAYVCSLSPEEHRQYRGTLTKSGQASPYRNRPPAENLDLFGRMRDGEFEEGAHVLRAKIDMASANINMRDPTLYRILKTPHHRTGTTWCIYPMYDFTHCLSDAVEGVTHSLCTLEFEDHRPLYEWVLDSLSVSHQPRQIEFARLNLTHTVMSKRKLQTLVQGGFVDGWDDPRLPTLAGLRRRGYTPHAIRTFCKEIGISKRNSTVDYAQLEHVLREELNKTAQRAMAVLHPVRLVIDNYPEGKVEQLDAVNNPENSAAGTRQLPFSRTVYIERDDFREDPPRKYFRLAPGREVRLRYDYIIKCTSVIKNSSGKIKEIHCTYDAETRSGGEQANRKVKSTIHWVSVEHSVTAEVRLYDHFFTKPDPEKSEDGKNFTDYLNPNSLTVLAECKIEPDLANPPLGSRFQFERQGYFIVDENSPHAQKPVFNRTVTLRDAWAKIAKRSTEG